MSYVRDVLLLRNRHFLGIDLIIFIGSGIVSFAIRQETFPFSSWHGVGLFLLLAIPLRLIFFFAGGMYQRYWVKAGPSELMVVALTCFLSTLAVFGAIILVAPALGGTPAIIPRSIAIIDGLLVGAGVLTARFTPRAYQLHLSRRVKPEDKDKPQQRVLIIGAGNTGIQVLSVLETARERTRAVGFLDDDASLHGTFLRGLKVFGGTDLLRNVVVAYDVTIVVIAIPSAPGKFVRRIGSMCSEIGVEYKIMPGFFDLVTGQVTVNTIRPVSIDDLLRRKPINLNTEDIRQQVSGNCIMVTGAGGSIGFELSRQIARFGPKTLLLVGHGENSLFAAERQINAEYPDLAVHAILADVRNAPRMAAIFAQYQPSIVFHAAAHKHVPMLESNAVEAVTNNVIATQNLIQLSNQFNASRMVLISTDKAVAPQNMLGLSKRTAELLILQAAQTHPQRFAAVRFGNVLGSRGSVVPIFQQQIASGGPITVTDERMTRFFMSIPEAVMLVLKAGMLVNHGPLFVLNMGEPVRIMDLATDLIKLSGLKPGQDIEIKTSGIRPGEKLYEALFWDYERHQALEEDTIYSITMPASIQEQTLANVAQDIEALFQAAYDYDEPTIRRVLNSIVYDGSAVANGG